MKRLNVIKALKYIAFCAILLLFVMLIPKYVIIPVTTFIITNALKLPTPWSMIVLVAICVVGCLALFGLPVKRRGQR